MKISVVMATYNGERYLEQQLQSILNQTLKPAEIIVCDDVSTDGTVVILEKYKQDGKLTYIVNNHQLGLIDNFKKAVSLAAEGNYVALSDQDDEWLPEKLAQSAALLQKIEDPELPCMVYTDLLLVDQNEKILNPSFRKELGQDKYQHNLETLVFGNFVNGCTMLMNPALKKLFAGIPNNVRLNHDGWMALVAFTFGKVASITTPLVRYRKHENNLSIAADTKPRNRYRSVMKEILEALKGNKDFLSPQFETVSRFYDLYQNEIAANKRQVFERFLNLKHKPYLFKKLAFGKIVRKFGL
jgi:glycosyltransferase involved in cell wall biosynthesis